MLEAIASSVTCYIRQLEWRQQAEPLQAWLSQCLVQPLQMPKLRGTCLMPCRLLVRTAGPDSTMVTLTQVHCRQH